MGGISSSIGLISGIDTASLIEQLLAIQSRPRQQIQLRVANLRAQQTGLLDINSRLNTFKTTAAAFRADDTFSATRGTTSDEEAIGITTSPDAAPGSYQFIVKQLVATSQQLSRGFASRDEAPLGLDQISFEFGQGRLSNDVDLEDLNGGSGVDRGTIDITDRDGNTAEIDLSDVVSVSEIVERINDADDIEVSAEIAGDGLVLTDSSGGSGNFIVEDGDGDTTATDLGIATVAGGVASSTITGSTDLYRLGANTPLNRLNDGRGVLVRDNVIDFTVTTASGATLEVDLGRINNSITTDTLLADLNNGAGVPIDSDSESADISITDRSGEVYEIDLSGSTTVGNIAGRIATATGNRIALTVNSTGDGFVVTDTNPGGDTGDLIVAGVDDNEDVPEALGILNPDGVAANVINGETVPSTIDKARTITIQDVIDRINQDSAESDGTANGGRIIASIAADGRGLRIQDTTTGGGNLVIAATGSNPNAATDLGILNDSATADLDGTRILGGLDSILLDSLNGGAGLALGGSIDITTRDGVNAVIDLVSAAPGAETVGDLIDALNAEISGSFLNSRFELNDSGNGLRFVDGSGGTGALTIKDTGADLLGLATGESGVLANSVVGSNLQAAYVGESTRLEDLNGGRGVGKGSFTIVDGLGNEGTVSIGGDEQSVYDVIQEINSRGLAINARINDNGDGIIIEEDLTDYAGQTPFQGMIITDTGGGTVARGLGIAGSASDVGDSIDGSYERTVDLDTSDTLEEVVAKINASGYDVSASIINTGAGSTPFRLNLSSQVSGSGGELVIDTGGVNLGLQATSRGRDARLFFGSDNPADALLVTSRTNQVTEVLDGVTLDLLKAGPDPVTVTVSRDVDAVVAQAEAFVTTFNDAVGRLDQYDFFDVETEERGVLLGDPTVARVRSSLFRAVNQRAENVTGTYQYLTQVGIRIGGDSQLSFDREKFLTAYESDPAGVEALFTAREVRAAESEEVIEGITVQNDDLEFTSLGFGPLFENLLDDLTNSFNGVITRADESFESQIELLEGRIENLDLRIEDRRSQLQREFANLELLLSDLQQQSSAISGLNPL